MKMLKITMTICVTIIIVVAVVVLSRGGGDSEIRLIHIEELHL